jgi:DNA repair protein RecN (Recombination protein N)
MLSALSVRDFILVSSLELEFGDGFTALTGETGAGKSILMAALSFALGGKGGQGLVRPGAAAAEVIAVFEAGASHPVRALLAAREISVEPGEALVFRRVMRRGAGAKAFLNDRAVSAQLLSEAALLLADIHGQHESIGLLDAARHRALLDAWAKAGDVLAEVSASWTGLREAKERRGALEARLARAAAERTWLAHALEDLDALAPEEGETRRLAMDRATMQAGERVADAIESAQHMLSKAGVETAISNAGRAVSRALSAPGLTGEGAGSELALRMRAACEGLERALIEAGEARTALSLAAASCEFSPAALEASETRLFALRAAARKYEVDADGLSALRARMRAQMDEIEHSDEALNAALAAEAAAQAGYDAAAAKLTAKRMAAAKKLGKAVCGELAPLKLEKAKFRIAVSARAQGGAGVL